MTSATQISFLDLNLGFCDVRYQFFFIDDFSNGSSLKIFLRIVHLQIRKTRISGFEVNTCETAVADDDDGISVGPEEGNYTI